MKEETPDASDAELTDEADEQLSEGASDGSLSVDTTAPLIVTSSGAAPSGSGELLSPEELDPLFSQHEILELIGKGGMGAVYKARHTSLDRLVAIKIIAPEVSDNPEFAQRFAREGRALAKLNHPNVVGVYDFGKAGDLFYLSMEYVEGTDLGRLLQSGKIPPAQAMDYVGQVCAALEYAHGERVIHRDIKPGNILVDTRGRVKITDFGLAKIMAQEPGIEGQLTRTQQTMGTPHYMAPEQVESSGQVDHRADIYSMGVVFYQLLTGELPIGRFDAPSSKCEVAQDVDEIVLKTLEKDPDRRYQAASDVATKIEALGDPKPPGKTEKEAPPAARERRRGFPKPLAIGLMVAAVLVLMPLVWRIWSVNRMGGEGSVAVGPSLFLLFLLFLLAVSAVGLYFAYRKNVWLGAVLTVIMVVFGGILGLMAMGWFMVGRVERGANALAGEAETRLAEIAEIAEGIAAPGSLNERAWRLVDPDRGETESNVALGLELARAAVAELSTEGLAADTGSHLDLAVRKDTLAWALFANGLYDEAVLESEQALLHTGDLLKDEYQDYLDRLQAMVAEARAARLEVVTEGMSLSQLSAITREASFDSDRVKTVERFASGVVVSGRADGQALSELMDSFDFDSGRVQALEALEGRLGGLAAGDLIKILGGFSFDSERKEAVKALALQLRGMTPAEIKEFTATFSFGSDANEALEIVFP